MAETVKTEKYTLFYKRLVHSTHIVRQDTGEEIAIPPETETLYSYMLDQYESYKARGKPFFESQESMGLKLKGRDRRWIAARIEVLNRLGLVKSEEQERDSYGHKRFHHTVIPLEEVSDNLLFYGPEKISGGPLAEGMLIRALEKKKPRGKPKSKKVAQPIIEESENGEQSVFVAPSPATVDHEQRSGVSQPAGDSGDAISSDDGVTGKNVVKMPWIESPFDNGRLVSEARRWAQSQGASTWQDEIKLVWKLTGKTNIGEPGEHMRPDDVPAPEPAKQKANGYTLYEGTPKEPDWNDDEQF
ncbi:hypothetical protein M8U86_14410 [Enterobacter hormaechei]|uniref:DUF6945 domain-containing protein n=1 Tax=Enterobacter nematophilus TaxID=2994648 RepID=A0ABT3VVS9_9ENTR|nr:MULTISPECIES: hypothetical protein [Enterobacteriaceae]KAE9723424.1 hypothetical protein GP710_22095 [Escherichia coli]HBY7498558.1 hypothetical protein [Klebsiella pneumoniae]HDR2604882.1 hypothetical protein [Enterobacter hormaechei subsp. oharae]MBF4152064.1 hypothetical protein [Enterobacter hormaechei]MCK6845637.1 hypothetical protein [Enterobacter cloacae]